ncbi:MAG TPA: ABC transporter permease [Bryobacteraceae bacterium]|nr:ABC transporter permease [Bryobacteraceae bacterium]
MARAREQQREARGLAVLDVLRQDLRFTLRTLRRDRAFACVVVLVLALGIGANVAVFSVVNTLLLRPLPFRDPGRLVWLATHGGAGGLSDQTYTVSAFEEFRRHNRSFQDVTSYQTFFNSIQYKLTGRGDPVSIVGVQVAENFFPLLGVEPVLGRLFTPDECRKGGRAAALLSYPFWQRQFGGDPAIVGQTIEIQAAPADITGPVTVIGVLPASFDFGSVFSPGMQVDFYVPAYMDFWRTWGNTLAVLGRLRPGVTLAQAQAEADLLFPQLRAAHREWWEDYKSTLFGLQDRVSGKLRRSLYVLWGAVGLILLIVCINISNLMLARAMSRGKEFAMRTALGAGRGRLVRQLLTESLVLSGAGAALGLAFAWAITSYLARQNQMALPLLSTVGVDGAALAWSVLIAVSVGAVSGLAPALKVSGGNLQEALKDGGPGMSQGRRHERLRATLVVSEVALACVLLIGAGLLLRSFVRLLDVDLGFAPARVAAVPIELNDGGNLARRAPIVQEILRRVRALPGIEAAGMTDMLPLDRNRSWGLVARENLNDRTREHGAFVYVVSPGYLETMGMRLRRGRDISWRDRSDAQPAVIVNEAAARREWPGQDPVGRTVFGVGRGEARVVGMVADVRESSLEDRASAQVYIPITQFQPEGTELVVRTRLPISAVERPVLSILRSLNPGQPRTRLRPIQQIVDHAVSPRRFLVLLVSAFAAFGLILASLGIYGVISYSVARQAQEIGIRMALGASAARIQFGVVAQTLRLALAGIGIGSAAAYIAARAIASLLFGTGPADPAIFAAMIALLAAVALAAGQIPARRAARIDPMAVLRGA